MAVLRAVENKRTLIRAANTGISGFVNPLGHVVQASGIFTESALVAKVPMLEITTVFNRNGRLFGAVCAFGLVFMVAMPSRRRS